MYNDSPKLGELSRQCPWFSRNARIIYFIYKYIVNITILCYYHNILGYSLYYFVLRGKNETTDVIGMYIMAALCAYGSQLNIGAPYFNVSDLGIKGSFSAMFITLLSCYCFESYFSNSIHLYTNLLLLPVLLGYYYWIGPWACPANSMVHTYFI